MSDIILPCCGAAVPAPPREIDCPGCGTHSTEKQVDGFQLQEITHVPAADVLRAAGMLNQPPSWIHEHRNLLDPMHSAIGLLCFPLTALRRLAVDRGLTIRPLPADGALWVEKPHEN